MNESTNASRPDGRRLNDYEELQLKLQSDDSWDRRFAERRIQDYYFERPEGSWVGQMVIKTLGQVPSHFVMQMDKVKPSKLRNVLSATLLVILMFAVSATIMLIVPMASIYSLFVLAFMAFGAISDIAIVIAFVALIFAVWLLRHKIYAVYSYDAPYLSKSVVSSADNIERNAGLQTMMYRLGAENWSMRQKIASLGISLALIGPFFVIILPVAFVPSIVIAYCYFMLHYISMWKKYSNNERAAIENTRLVADYRRLLPLYVAACMVVWFIAVDFWPSFGRLLVEIGQALQG